MAEAGRWLGKHLGRKWWTMDQAGASSGKQRLLSSAFSRGENYGIEPQSMLFRGTLGEASGQI